MIPTKKTYQFNAEYQTDDLDFAVGVSLFDQNDNMVFSAWNLNECPEDAVIGRDLFDEKDFIKAVKLGMELAKQGYDDVKYVDPTGLYGPKVWVLCNICLTQGLTAAEKVEIYVKPLPLQ